MKLHVFPPSPRAFKVLAVATHLGVDYELCIVDLAKGEQRSAAFAALNPNCKMPVLQDGDVTLWESNAIIRRLAAKTPDAGLSPSNDRQRAELDQWLFWESTTWDPACSILIGERFVKPALGLGAPDPVEVEKGLQKFAFAAGILENQLRGRDFITGDRLSLADIAIGSPLTLAEPAQLPLEDYPEIRRWRARLEALPAWMAVRALQRPPVAA